jgi:hypothetical protein
MRQIFWNKTSPSTYLYQRWIITRSGRVANQQNTHIPERGETRLPGILQFWDQLVMVGLSLKEFRWLNQFQETRLNVERNQEEPKLKQCSCPYRSPRPRNHSF